MSDAIETVDITSRATAGGWSLPVGWSVKADMTSDPDNMIPSDHADCYTPAQVERWLRDDWTFVTVSVWVEDASGREWGHAALGMVEYGDFPMTNEDGEIIGTEWVTPLYDVNGYSVIRDNDMIREALQDAVEALETFGSPVITSPKGITITGL